MLAVVEKVEAVVVRPKMLIVGILPVVVLYSCVPDWSTVTVTVATIETTPLVPVTVETPP